MFARQIVLVLAVSPLCLAFMSRKVTPLNATVPGTQSFVNVQAAGASKAVPALQPADVFDSDFPVDMAGLTPQELRYRAQADYAKAIAALKREAAEAEAARLAMEKELKELIAAKEAAANAKARAEKAAKEAAALKAALAKSQANANAEGKEAAGAKGAISKEEAELAAAKTAYDDALKAEGSLEAKMAAMQKKHEELCAQIKKVESEKAAAEANRKHGVGAAKNGVEAAEQDIESAEDKAAREAKEAELAAKEAAAAKARLAAAEAAATGKGKGEMDAETARLHKEYEMSKERYTKEANDVKAAQKRVQQAKAELAKWEPAQGSARAVAPMLTAMVLCVLSGL